MVLLLESFIKVPEPEMLPLNTAVALLVNVLPGATTKSLNVKLLPFKIVLFPEFTLTIPEKIPEPLSFVVPTQYNTLAPVVMVPLLRMFPDTVKLTLVKVRLAFVAMLNWRQTAPVVEMLG